MTTRITHYLVHRSTLLTDVGFDRLRTVPIWHVAEGQSVWLKEGVLREGQCSETCDPLKKLQLEAV